MTAVALGAQGPAMATEAVSTERVDRLQAVPLLARLSSSQLRRLAEVGAERTFPAGEPVVREGENGQALYVILEGEAEVRRSGRTTAALAAGQFFGEAALLVERPRTADVWAASDLRCLVIRRWDFWSAIGVDPEANRSVYEATVRRLRAFRPDLVE
jgi:CRP-like cAMP-binding protein